MFTVMISEKGGDTRSQTFDRPEVTIGRVQGNDIILPKGNVSKRHARVVLKDGRFIVVDLKSTNGTYVNGRKITSPLVVKGGDKIYIGDFVLTLEPAGATVGGESVTGNVEAPPAPPPLPGMPAAPPLPRRTDELAAADGEGHGPPEMSVSASGSESVPSRRFPLDQEPPPSSPPAGPPDPVADEAFAAAVVDMDAPPPVSAPPARASAPASPFLPPMPGISAPPPPPPAPPPAASVPAPFTPPKMAPLVDATPPPPPAPAPAPRPAPPAAMPPAGLVSSGVTGGGRQPRPVTEPGATAARAQAYKPPASTASADSARNLRSALQLVMSNLAGRFDLHDATLAGLHDPGRRARAETEVDAVIEELSAAGEVDGASRDTLTEAALREAVGLGALEELLADTGVRELVVEGPAHVVADRGRGLKGEPLVFSTPQQLATIALRLLAQAGVEATASDPIHRVTLPYGPQVTVMFPPVAVRGTLIEIRRMASGISGDDLVGFGMLSTEMLELLRTAVLARRNIVVIGPSGSGVTTVLGAVANFVDNSQRIVTVEEVPDLPIDRDHVVALAAGPRVSGPRLGELTRQAAKLRADRLVVDDVRGGELYDVFSVLSARRPGNFVGIHAETEQALSHLPLLVRRGSGLSQEDATHLTTQVVHLLVALDTDDDGRGYVTRIVEMGTKGGERIVRDLWARENGKFLAKGTPSFSG